MSDPVTDVEIEDVLSSIRRLVGDEHRIKSRPKPVELPKRPSRLVLTPSLLVPVADASELEAGAVPGPDSEPDSGPDSGSAPDPDSLDSAPEDTGPEDTGPDVHQPGRSEAGAETPDPQPTQHAWPDKRSDPDAGSETETGSDGGSPVADDRFDAEAEADAEEPAGDRGDRAATEAADDDPFAGDAHSPPWHDPDSTLFQAADSVGSGREDDASHVDGDEFPGEHRGGSEPAPDAQTAEGPDTGDTEAPACDTPDNDADDAAVTAWPDPDQAGLPDGQKAEDARDAPELADPGGPGTGQGSRDDPAGPAEAVRDGLSGQPEGGGGPIGDPEDDVPYSTATLSAKIAALEAKIGQTQDQWEPDGEMGDDYAGTHVETIKWQDHKVDETSGPLRPALNPAALDPGFVSASSGDTGGGPGESGARDGGGDGLDLLDNDDAILDEESLRELVADIVRQELQGALGERITRNVRKLVRREIHRALTAQELD